MKQILQDLRQGDTIIEDVPCPVARPGELLIRTRQTLVSVGTEKMLVDFGKGNLLQKAMQQPDKVPQVLEKVRSDGLAATWEAVPSPLQSGGLHLHRTGERRPAPTIPQPTVIARARSSLQTEPPPLTQRRAAGACSR